MRKWMIEFLRKFENRSIKFARILITKSINLVLILYGLGVRFDLRRISVLSPFIEKSMPELLSPSIPKSLPTKKKEKEIVANIINAGNVSNGATNKIGELQKDQHMRVNGVMPLNNQGHSIWAPNWHQATL